MSAGAAGPPEADDAAVDPEAGAALVEFLGTAVLLLVPLVYLVLTLAQVQAGAFAVEGAAREAGRAMVTADSSAQGAARAGVAAGIALADQGFDDVDPDGALSLRCSADPCLTPGAQVVVRAQLAVPLPFVPAGLRDWVPLEIPVEATHVATVDEYGQVRP
ncbi:pilus assembly protein [Isoptericola sp. NEAU-Y5]|uniref:Pilus assembly protein n=1 Tax=Isoptericola luteus TaxID=2879484 RepID=A0ABS7ZGH1_9MICO|nr:pilus assembly protein [Isoptericola sp. NEAU-Y5]MCA5893406.1 pilus assembly protein [Isoptericola sp. NEAU-Y5]